MIVRLLGEGQFRLDEAHLDALNVLDDELEAALDRDGDAFSEVLARMAELVRTVGTPEPPDFLGASDVTIPDPDSTREDVRGLLAADGLVPG